MNTAQRLTHIFYLLRGGGKAPWLRRVPYTGRELRAIRKRNGVGRPPAVNRARRGS